MSKTYIEGLDNLIQKLIDSGRLLDAPSFAGKLNNLFVETALNNILFDFYKNPPLLSQEENKGLQNILEPALKEGDILSTKKILALGSDLPPPHKPFFVVISCAKGNKGLVEILLQSGADVNTPALGRKPIVAAAINGRIEVVKLLAEEYNATTISDGRFSSPLVQVAEELVKRKSESDAQKKGLKEVVQYFISKGVTNYDCGTRGASISKEEFDAVIAEQTAIMEAEAAIVNESLNTASNLDLIAPRDFAQFTSPPPAESSAAASVDSEDYVPSGAAGGAGVPVTGNNVPLSDSDV